MASFYLRSSGSGGNDSLIYVFLSVKGKWIRVSTGLQINPKYWNEDKQRSRENREFNAHVDLNRKLKEIDEYVEQIKKQAKYNNLSYQDIKDAIIEYFRPEPEIIVPEPPEPETPTLFSFIEEYIETSKISKKNSTIKVYSSTQTHLKNFEAFTGYTVDFDTINLDFYNKFLAYLINEKGQNNNTSGKYIDTLKTFLREATERDINTNMFFTKKKFKSLREDAENIYLNEKELTKIYKLDLSQKPSFDRVRDIFIIGCCTGLRFSDLSRLTKDNIRDGNIHIRTIKTDQPVVIPLHYWVKEVLDKYDNKLPRTLSNQKMNKYLKDIVKDAKIEEVIMLRQNKGSATVHTKVLKYELVTTHTARRSAATNMYLAGVPTIAIMKITGHKTESAFMRYIKVSAEDNAKVLQLHSYFTGKASKLKAVR